MKYVVNRIENRREIETKYGPQVAYTLLVTDEDGDDHVVDLLQKPESAPPVGEIHGSVEETAYGKRLRKDPHISARGGGSSGSWRSAPEYLDFEKRRQTVITRSAMLNTAVAYHNMIADRPDLDGLMDTADRLFHWVFGRDGA